MILLLQHHRHSPVLPLDDATVDTTSLIKLLPLPSILPQQLLTPSTQELSIIRSFFSIIQFNMSLYLQRLDAGAAVIIEPLSPLTTMLLHCIDTATGDAAVILPYLSPLYLHY
eukprot:507926_1